jgi:integrase
MRCTGHIRQRSPGSWELRYSLGSDRATGRRRVATTTVQGTRKDAEREMRRLLHSLDIGAHVDATRMTVQQWLKAWLDAVRSEVSPKSHERYTELVDGFLVPTLGSLPISKLVPSHIQKVYSDWATGGRRDGKEGGLSPQTRRHIHRILKAALARAVEQQIIARNPADAFKKRLPKVERRPMTVLTPAQSMALLVDIRVTAVYAPTLIGLATGMRRGEILALRWHNLDLDRGIVHVVESLEQTKKGLRFKAPKTNKARSITLPSFAIDELRRLKRAQAEVLMAMGVRQAGDTLVCAREDGEPWSPHLLTKAFTRVVGTLENIPVVRFHDLRHSHASQLLSAGVHPKVVQERLGHSTITTTLDLYSHVAETIQLDAATRLDAVFRGAINRAGSGK